MPQDKVIAKRRNHQDKNLNHARVFTLSPHNHKILQPTKVLSFPSSTLFSGLGLPHSDDSIVSANVSFYKHG